MEGRDEFLPEVAGKLRILLVRTRTNVPLLFRVAEELGVDLKVRLTGPPVAPPPGEPGLGAEITLEEFFGLFAVAIRTSQGLVSMSKRQLIIAWSQQLGGVHEDWKVDEALENAVQFPIPLAGLQPSSMELRNCALTALQHGRRVIEVSNQLRAATEAGNV